MSNKWIIVDLIPFLLQDFFREDYANISHEYYIKQLDLEDQKIVFLKHQEVGGSN